MAIPTAMVIGVGADQGLGAALCRRFSAGGYHVFVAGHTAIKIEAAARAIVLVGGHAEPVETDATCERDVARLFDRAMAPGGELEPADLIVYNVGNNRRVDFRELSAETFERILAPQLLRRLPRWT